MLKKLHRKLSFLFFAIIGCILLGIILCSFFIVRKQTIDFNLSTYRSNLNRLSFQFTNSKLISNSLLSKEESETLSLIHLELNGIPILFKGSYYIEENRASLVEEVRRLADGMIDVTEFWETDVISSPLFTLEDYKGRRCYGAIQYWNEGTERKTFLYVQCFPDEKNDIRSIGIILSLITLAGLIILFISSYLLVGRALKPVAENNRRQTAFVAAASHELRSPLTVILNNAIALRFVSDEAKQFTTPIERECSRMARLIEDMLTLASSDAKTWDLKGEQIETDTFIIGIYEKYKPLCEKRGHPLMLELSEDFLPVFTGDGERLEQVFAILLDNALSYTPQGTVIVLRADVKGHTLILQVIDHGPGIADKDKKLIFDRFYKADRSRKEKEHYGLGLSIAKELVTLHNGRIYLKDTPNGGACFVIELKV